MKPWIVEYTAEAENDISAFDNSQISQILKAINKVSQNPLPQSEGGYGKPLGNKQSNKLSGLYKIKLLKLGIRVIYELVRTDEIMEIIVVAARADSKVYEIAEKRMKLNYYNRLLKSKRQIEQGKIVSKTTEELDALIDD
jgi:mRNA interferase RelE/StbE